MEKTVLHKIFSKSYNHEDWLNVLQVIFGVKVLYTQPKPILLPNNDRATEAFELGNFTTTDDRIIGLYRINIKPDVWLERNKVSLRELLRNVYKYDVDGAIVVFVQGDKWRLSFISEIKVLNEEGEVLEQATEPKRYTYLLGKDEKVRTPSERLGKLVGKTLSIQDILNAFSVEALNEEFYKIVQSFFYELVGGKVGKGKITTDYGAGILELPNIVKNDRQIYQEFAVRLIGRTVFCWFLKMKKSNEGKSLLPEYLLSSAAVKTNNNYYHKILEPLFFQTLNTPMEQRVEHLPNGTEIVPFLNGGLFEPGIQDFYKPDKETGLNENLGALNINDKWFLNFFLELEKYNFTIDENSVTDVEVSVDPEMLGRIFENLLAEIDPDSGETARKATGSFYTPREIVDYMATESLVQYIHNKTYINPDKLRPIFKFLEHDDPNSDKEIEDILNALDQVKILDPACGSGAFPMGVLQKIVQALQKLDPDAKWWKKRQIDNVRNATKNSLITNQFKEKLESSGVEYARKIGIIQNSLYGIDIQPIAAEISKLRCFLSLIVDENIDENKANRGIEPLPNLEFKFVTADTLSKLPEENGVLRLTKRGEKTSLELEEDLQKLRQEYIQSFGEQKKELKLQFIEIQNQLFNQQDLFGEVDTSRSYKISTWNPFGSQKSNWFDSKWMFGIDKFDIVIGNPPYVLLQNTRLSIEDQKLLRGSYITAQYKTDLYHLFIEQGFELLKKDNGILCYITPNTYLKNKHNDLLRKFILDNSHVKEVIRFYVPIFKNASVDNAIIIANKKLDIKNEVIEVKDILDNKYSSLFKEPSMVIPQKSIMTGDYYFDFDVIGNPILKKIKSNLLLKDFGRAYFGIQTLDRNTFVSENKTHDDQKPVVDGGNITRYYLKPHSEYVLFSPNAIKSGGNMTVYNRERILVRQIGKYPEGCYCPPSIYTLNTIYNIYVNNENKTSIKFLLSLINSSLVRYYWIKTFSDRKETFPKIKKDPLESIPVPIVDYENQKAFVYIVDNLIILYKMIAEHSDKINAHVSNKHIAERFEEVLDAMVMELYFKEEFNKVGIEFIKYASRDFKETDTLNNIERIETIHTSYQKLRLKDNEISNNLKLMNIKLSDIVMPIKSTNK
jgi:hypothetical protein